VLVLEAGGKDDWIWFHIPVGYLFAIGNPRADWMFKTEAEPGLGGRALNYPRGKVIGGCSAINAMISMRGQAGDHDHWRQLGLSGWGWDDVLPLFKHLDDHFLGDTEHHASGGNGGSKSRASAGKGSRSSIRGGRRIRRSVSKIGSVMMFFF
jgi:choline dehydrogenase-like flavoprotein